VAGDRWWCGPHRTPSGSLARGIACPPPGVNRDPPAQAPAETFGPEVDQSSAASSAALRDLPTR
jgi:hypothetical protein